MLEKINYAFLSFLTVSKSIFRVGRPHQYVIKKVTLVLIVKILEFSDEIIRVLY